jgi:golgi phosphoprotein 3
MVRTFEALFILALDDEDGDIVESFVTALELALAGAVLAELVLQNRISMEENRVFVTDQTPTEHPILDKAMFDIVDTGKRRKIQYWINTLTYKKLKDEIAHHLVAEGVLVRKKKRLHLVIPDEEGQGGKVSAKYILKNRLRDTVLTGSQPDLSEKVLLAFLYHSELSKLVFTQGERKAAHKRVKKILAYEEEGSGLGGVLDEIIETACGFAR